MAAATELKQPVRRAVRIWLIVGLVMVFFQVVIGGITRLTDSGLSITEWEVVKGTLPPLNAEAWDVAFEKYKVHTAQYERLHADMTLSEFKVIYFWEWFHRLWARSMGLVFAIPFFFFLAKGWLPKWLVRRLGVVVLFAALAGTVGWIMVASGLNDDTRTWVSAYKLITHLSIAMVLFGYLYWTYRRAAQPVTTDGAHTDLRRMAWSVFGLLLVQIALGGLMAGMRAGLLHPYFPLFVNGDRLLGALQGSADFADYETGTTVKGIVHIAHRVTAYLLTALIAWFFVRVRRRAGISLSLRRGNWGLLAMIGVQFLLGVLTVINSFGRIPLVYGVLHQAGALITLALVLYMAYQLRKPKFSTNVHNTPKVVENPVPELVD